MNYDEIEKKRFGRRLAMTRIISKVTQRELAKSVNINFQELYRYENGLRMPRDTILEALAAALVAPVDRLKYDDPYTESYQPPFYVKDIGHDFGKEYTLQHGFGSTRKVSVNSIFEKLKKLDPEELRIVEEFVNGVYLDSHPDELQAILDKEDEDFEQFRKQFKKTKENNKFHNIRRKLTEDVYRLFPEKYDEYIERKKTLKEIDTEINQFILDEYPELAEAFLENDMAQKFAQSNEGEDLTAEDLYKMGKLIHSKFVPELAKAMRKDQKKRPSKDTMDEIYEANINDHIIRLYKEGRLKFPEDIDPKNLTEEQLNQIAETLRRSAIEETE